MQDNDLRIAIAATAGVGGLVLTLIALVVIGNLRQARLARLHQFMWPFTILGVALVALAMSVLPNSGFLGRLAGFAALGLSGLGVFVWILLFARHSHDHNAQNADP
jgi:hypothetical protein